MPVRTALAPLRPAASQVVRIRTQLLDRVWGTDYLGDGNLIEVHISALREKLGDQDRRLIRTVRGVGYALSGAGLG